MAPKSFALACLLSAWCLTLASADDRLSFQTSGPWSDRVELNADVAMVYGIGPSFARRAQTWRDHGYHVALMTGIAWGGYQDYLDGRYDGTNHRDEIQADRNGQPLRHGDSDTVFYLSPGEAFGGYIASGVKKALDAGAEAVYLEEPEFWARSGWEENFKREWQKFYGEPWQPPDSSPEAQYRASKLKYFLYRRALGQVFDAVRKYGDEHHRRIPCYVATHSLLNYAHWHIVSPESSLAQVGCDGYIAQVWTGTSRTPNVYAGQLRERTFETAFLEYGAAANLARDGNRAVWFLNDPVEDNPNHTWEDYRAQWENTLTASLLHPDVWRYEIMPWPQRVFDGRYRDAATGKRVTIPSAYATELQAVISALGDMKQPADRVKWEISGTPGVGVLVSDTMMFQRDGPAASDEHLGSFYGLALPLLEKGVPVEPVQIESATAPLLDRYKLLLLTYEGQKPPDPRFHAVLADWVKRGGALVVADDDKDPFLSVREWWNTPPLRFRTPREHLFEAMGLKADVEGLQRVGRGAVVYAAASPATLSYRAEGLQRVTDLAREVARAIGIEWKEANALTLRRGPYLIAAAPDDLPPDAPPAVLRGRFINLFDASLPVIDSLTLTAGKRALLLDLDSLSKGSSGVIAAACRVRGQHVTAQSMHFRCDGVEDTQAVVCTRVPARPQMVMVAGKSLPPEAMDFADGLVRCRFSNSATPVEVEIDQ